MATVFAVKAAAGKRAFSASVLSEKPLVIRVEIPAAPEKGAANRELGFRLEELLCCSVQIIAGKASRRKTLAADCPEGQIIEKIKGEKHGKNVH